MNHDITSILKCPVSGGDVENIPPELLKELNSKILRKETNYITGELVTNKIDQALISKDRKFIYVILDGIILLRQDLAIIVDKNYFETNGILELRGEKKIVQDFYNEHGWHKSVDDNFEDAEIFEDLRPVAKKYCDKCHQRVSRHLEPEGKYLLDAGSGPIQYKAYLKYSENYKYRICVDLTVQALNQAKNKLGDKGIYLIADITNLPIKDNVLDGAISLNVIYHIPKDEQKTAIEEIMRTIKSNRNAVIIYSWGDKYSLFMDISLFYIKLILLFDKLYQLFRSKLIPNRGKEGLYFHAFPPSYFNQDKWDNVVNILCWRSISVPFSKIYAHERLGGRKLLRWIYNWEEKHPKTAGKYGQYPMIVMTKK